MKKVILFFALIEYAIYALIIFTTLWPSTKSLIEQTRDSSFKYMGFGMVFIPAILGTYCLYKAFTNIENGIFWIFAILAFIIPILATFVAMFLMM